ncbi:MAG TPA: right-handed parallel beta-helix repeat-containing protein [Vicinamibacterales bacterium]
MRRAVLFAIAVGTAAMCLKAEPAHAQATRTWVSGVGDDANPCSRTAPCKTFAGAISKTATGGEINVLDPGGFGAVTITKSISITSVGFEAGVLVSGTNGIVVNVGATDKVLLEGLDIEGLGTGLNGVTILGGGKTTIRKCSIRSFTQNGVNLQGTANARVVVEDSVILNNGGGFNMLGNGGAMNTAFIVNTTLDNNTNFATQVGGANVLVLSNSILTGSPFSIHNNGGEVWSYGNNILRNSGVPTQTLVVQ